MFYPKQDIFGQNWLDIIFEGRNKQYGAYALRKDAAKTANIALFITSSVFVIILTAPLIQDRLFPNNNPPSIFNNLNPGVIVELIPPPPIDPSVPEPSATPPSAPHTSQVRMVPPMIVNANMVTEEPPSIAILKLTNPGSKTIDGNPDATIHIDVPVGLGHGDATITESAAVDNTPFIQVEILQFIVERDGSLTDIKIVRDLKFGTGEEAVRLLKASPKWNPGIQNGRAVRVAYTLPIGLDISQ